MKDRLAEGIADQMQHTRRLIVMTLRQRGGMTAAELAAELGITSMGVRRHLTTLERDRLVAYDLMQRGKGRPSYIYHLSERAENLFPKNYAQLANELLGYLSTRSGEDAVIELFVQRAQRRIRTAQLQLEGLSLADRVAGLAQFLSAEGYFADWQQVDEDTFLLSEHNCALRDVAEQFRAACSAELDFLQAMLPDADVVREQHMMAGEPRCRYRIQRHDETTRDV